MKRLTCLLLLATSWSCGATVLPARQDPSRNAVNREPARAYSMPLARVEDALVPGVPATPYVKSLNGTWKFHWCGTPSQRPRDIGRPDFDDSRWTSIDVPSCVEMRGYGVPHYVAHGYPHKVTPPAIDDAYNPVSSYRRTFTVPADWAGREVFLRFEGVGSACHVWLNGHMVGYSEDSKLPAEFNVTPYLKDENLLAVEVYRWCDGSYLEDQDMYRFSGIFRDVELFAMPKDGVRDFAVTTEVADDFASATVRVTGDVSARLFDADFKEVPLTLAKPRLWSPEDPYLYTLVVTRNGDVRSCKVGVRRIDRTNGKILLNGVPLKLRGVNRHENSPAHGRTVSKAEMEQDARLMRQNNIDCVRTCHYPDHPYWYELCDRWGICLVAEANVESHGMCDKRCWAGKGSGHLPEWRQAIVERNVNHVLNYRNHPCIVFWSLGNESGDGENFAAAAAAVRALDPTRPIHYEPDNAVADVDSQMYPPVPWVWERGALAEGRIERMTLRRGGSTHHRGKPAFLCEYAHAMGNAVGNLAEYWEAIWSCDGLVGGCIWDWADQALWKDTDRIGPDGRRLRFLAYGGDWDEDPGHDGPVCVNGLVDPLRRPSAKLAEVRHVYRSLVVTSTNAAAGVAELWNRHAFTRADAFDGSWRLLEDGAEIARGRLPVPPVAPRSRGMLKLPLPAAFRPVPGREYFYNVSFALRAATPWAPKGHVVAADQLPLSAPASTAERNPAADVRTASSADAVVVTAGGTAATFSRASGTLSRLVIDGKTVLADEDGVVAGPRLTTTRAFTDNDATLRLEKTPRDAYFASGLTQLHYVPEPIDLTPSGVVCTVRVNGSKSGGFRHRAEWVFAADGSVRMENDVEPFGKLPQLPRLGLSWRLDPSLEQVRWYGRGPWENYVDRKSGSFIGLYASTVSEQYVDYVRPQDCGYKCDVRWWQLADGDGKGVRFSADVPLFAQALHYTWEDLEFARHRRRQGRVHNVRQPRPEVFLNLDVRQLGLGGASCGPGPLPQYVFPARHEHWTIRLVPAR